MSNKKINISEEILTIDMLTQRISVVLSDLENNYFADDTYAPEDRGKKGAFNEAGIRVTILQDFVNDLQETIENLENNI